jgi:hypothetical protein
MGLRQRRDVELEPMRALTERIHPAPNQPLIGPLALSQGITTYRNPMYAGSEEYGDSEVAARISLA